MIRNTLQECISLYDNNPILRCYAVKGMEQLGEWETAAKYWEKLGRKEDADACRMIVEANERGDAYRASVANLVIWQEQTVEAGIMTEEEAAKVAYTEMKRLYDLYYPNSIQKKS